MKGDRVIVAIISVSTVLLILFSIILLDDIFNAGILNLDNKTGSVISAGNDVFNKYGYAANNILDATDYDEMERVEILSGLNNLFVSIYITVFTLSILFAFLLKNQLSSFKLFLFSIYLSVSIAFILDLILHLSYPFWGLAMSLQLYFEIISSGILSPSLIIAAGKLNYLVSVFKENELIYNTFLLFKSKITGSGILQLLAKSWILFTLLIAKILFYNILVNLI